MQPPDCSTNVGLKECKYQRSSAERFIVSRFHIACFAMILGRESVLVPFSRPRNTVVPGGLTPWLCNGIQFQHNYSTILVAFQTVTRSNTPGSLPLLRKASNRVTNYRTLQFGQDKLPASVSRYYSTASYSWIQ